MKKKRKNKLTLQVWPAALVKHLFLRDGFTFWTILLPRDMNFCYITNSWTKKTFFGENPEMRNKAKKKYEKTEINEMTF